MANFEGFHLAISSSTYKPPISEECEWWKWNIKIIQMTYKLGLAFICVSAIRVYCVYVTKYIPYNDPGVVEGETLL